MRWCFDTSALIEPWVRLYPPDIFTPVWSKIESLVDSEVISAPVDVLHELARQKDDLYTWSKARTGLFRESDRKVMEVFTDIVNDYPDFLKINSTKSGADPFVVAMAEVHSLTVVTYETKAKKDASPKIPNVCESRGVKYVQLVDVLRAEGFRL